MTWYYTHSKHMHTEWHMGGVPRCLKCSVSLVVCGSLSFLSDSAMDITLHHPERFNLSDDLNQGPGKTCSSPQKRQKVESTTSEGRRVVEDTLIVRQASGSDRRDRYVRGRRGHLKHMTEIPIDTLHEIFLQLEPLDLLNLSWASKSLRGIVMEKSGRYIWKQVYERLYESGNPPPRCPEDINLAQYTRFLYHKRCMVCDTRIGHHTSWMMRLRACHHCLTNTALFSTYRYTSEGLLSIRSKKSSFVWKSELEEIKEGRGPSANERYKLRAVRMEGTREFDEWEERCADSQTADLERRRTERKDAIMKKLEEIGWKESYIRDLNCGSIPFGLPGFGISKKLTKKDWEAIEFEIVHRLSDLEHQNLPRLKQRRLQTRWRLFETKFNEWNENQTSPEWSFRPRLADISILEPFRTVIFCSSDRDEIHYDFKMEDIDRVAKEWMASRDSYIFSLLPQDLQDLYQGYKPSLPPLAIFRFCGSLHGTIDLICASRENALSYPLSLELDSQDRDIYKTIIKLASSSPPLCPWNWNWHNRDFIFDIKAYRITIDILEFLGMDPYTTTVAETAQFKQTKFRCFMCKNPWLPLNSFELMIEHDLLCHDNPEDEQMLPVSGRWITAVDTIASDFLMWSNDWQETEYHSIFLE